MLNLIEITFWVCPVAFVVTCPADSRKHKTCKETNEYKERWNKWKLGENHVQETENLQFFNFYIILRLGIIIYPRYSTKNYLQEA